MDELWELKDLRKTCATYYDEHLPESSVEILGHSVGGITYRHYAHRAPLAFKAIMTIPQPTAFSALIHGHDGECPCCRRPFADAARIPARACSRKRIFRRAILSSNAPARCSSGRGASARYDGTAEQARKPKPRQPRAKRAFFALYMPGREGYNLLRSG